METRHHAEIPLSHSQTNYLLKKSQQKQVTEEEIQKLNLSSNVIISWNCLSSLTMVDDTILPEKLVHSLVTFEKSFVICNLFTRLIQTDG